MPEETVVKKEEVKEKEKVVQKEVVQSEETKNKIMELNRKLEASERDKQRMEQELVESRKTKLESNDDSGKENEDPEWIQISKKIAEDVSKKVYQQMSKTNSNANSSALDSLDKLESDEKIGSAVKKYRAEIETNVGGLSPDLKTNPQAVARVARMVIGGHLDEFVSNKPAEPDKNKKLTPLQTGSGEGAKTPSAIDTELTPDEDRFAEKRGYYDHGYSVQQIKERYQKNQERIKKNREAK